MQPLLSICIPTKNRVDILRKTLESILNQNVSADVYEVCVSDNSPTDETKNLIQNEFQYVSNLRYQKSNCEGFLNSMEALKLGKGKLLKLHNDYSKFKDGSIEKMVNVTNKYMNSKPAIFFAMKTINNPQNITEFHDFNSFLYNISYWSTWSSAFAIWKSDLDALIEHNIQVDFMFPHTTLLFSLTEKSLYVVDDDDYVENIPPKKKGGYNLVNNFVHIYLTMVHNLLEEKKISTTTYKQIEHRIIKFGASWYAIVLTNSNYTFTFENKNKLIKKQSGLHGLLEFYLYCSYYCPKAIIKKIIKNILGYKS